MSNQEKFANVNQIPNPQKTKKAIAIKYAEGLDAPIITAKGDGKIAEKILTEAQKNSILIEEDATLIDMLGFSDVGSVIPQNAWKSLALIFSYILKNDLEKNE